LHAHQLIIVIPHVWHARLQAGARNSLAGLHAPYRAAPAPLERCTRPEFNSVHLDRYCSRGNVQRSLSFAAIKYMRDVDVLNSKQITTSNFAVVILY
jgi:hypothetical protein